jgi:hypothetical protein
MQKIDENLSSSVIGEEDDELDVSDIEIDFLMTLSLQKICVNSPTLILETKSGVSLDALSLIGQSIDKCTHHRSIR